MQKNLKKCLSLLLIFVMVLSMFPFTYANDPAENSEVTDSTLIEFLNLAKSQVGYTVPEDGRTIYDDWWGSSTDGDWGMKFVSYCLETAGVTVLPLESDIPTWVNILSNAQTVVCYYEHCSALEHDHYAPGKFDIVVMDYDGDAVGDHGGIVLDGRYVDDVYTMTMVVPNHEGQVALVERPVDSSLLGTVRLDDIYQKIMSGTSTLAQGGGTGGGGGFGSVSSGGGLQESYLGVDLQVLYYHYKDVYNDQKMYEQVINSVVNYSTAADNAMNAAGQKLDGNSYATSSIFAPYFLTDNLYVWHGNSSDALMYQKYYNRIYRLTHLPDGFHNGSANGGQARNYGGRYWYGSSMYYDGHDESDGVVTDAEMSDFFKRIIAGNGYGNWDMQDVWGSDSLYAKMLKACGASDADVANYNKAIKGQLSVTDDGDVLIPTLVWKTVVFECLNSNDGASDPDSYLYVPCDIAAAFTNETNVATWWKTAYPWDYTSKTGTSYTGSTATIYRSSVYDGIAQYYTYSDGSSKGGRCAYNIDASYACKILFGTGHDSVKSHTSWPSTMLQPWANGAGFVNAISNEGVNTTEYGRNVFHYRNYWTCIGAGSGNVTIKKVSSSNTNTVLANATFKMYKNYDFESKTFSNPITNADYASGSATKGDAGYVDAATRTTGADGLASWTGLYVGTYWLEEVIPPNGYKRADDGTITVNVTQGGNTKVITNDTDKQEGKIEKKFSNAPSGTPKNGWIFDVHHSSCTNHVANCGGTDCQTGLVTDASGVIVGRFTPGNYTVYEVGHTDSSVWNNAYLDKSNMGVGQAVTVTEGSVATLSITNTWRGKLSVTKTTNTGKNLKGWKFEIYDGNTLVGTITTDKNGYAESGLVTVGKTYTVKEVTGSDAYWAYDTSSESVKIEANKTKNVTFENKHYGRLTWAKSTNTGAELAGWKFGIYTDKDCTKLASYKDGSAAYAYSKDNGSVTSGYLLPGTYYVKEIDESASHPEWGYSGVVKSGKVVAGSDKALTDTGSFENLKYGRIRIQKTTNTGRKLSGWEFTIYVDSACNTVATDRNGSPATMKTDSNGEAISGYLLPGTYYVKETGNAVDNDVYWVMDTSKETVTVVAGEDTDEIEFVNTEYGRFTLKKTTNTGADKDNWIFTVYTDSACTTVAKDKNGNNVTLTTDANGAATSGYLLPGTYYVKETGGNKYSNPYWKPDADKESVVVTAGSTNQTPIVFDNPHYGRIVVEKSTNTGNNLSGWTFTVYTDANCRNVAKDKNGQNVTMVSKNNGVATSGYLLPGTYYVKETNGVGFEDGQDYYWTVSTETKTVTVVAGQDVRPAAANGVFTNTHYGRLQVIKDMDTVELNGKKKLAGWQFQITRNSDGADMGVYTTDANGELITDKLLPGEYTITEIIDEVNGYYYCETTNPLTAIVTEGQTKLVGGRERAGVSFVNALRPMKIVLDKVNHLNQPLAGVEFSLEWSTDGVNWTRVTYSDAENVIVGKCGSTGLTRNGTLLTDANGHLEFVNLYPGIHYRVTEENTLNGYTLLTAPHDIAPDDVEIQTLTYDMRVVNTPGYELPESGVSDMSTNLMVIGGTCAAVLVMFGMFSLHTETSVFRRRRTIKNKK